MHGDTNLLEKELDNYAGQERQTSHCETRKEVRVLNPKPTIEHMRETFVRFGKPATSKGSEVKLVRDPVNVRTCSLTQKKIQPPTVYGTAQMHLRYSFGP